MQNNEIPHVVYGVDSNYVLPALVSIYSIWRHTSGNIDITIFGHRLSEHDIDTIQHAANKCDRNITLLDYCPKEFEGYAVKRFPVVSLLPLSLPYIFDGRCIFIDADTLVLSDISELFSIDMGVMPIGACFDFLILDIELRLLKLRIFDLVHPARSRKTKISMVRRMVKMGLCPGQPSFNSGVLVMNCKAIQEIYPSGELANLKLLKPFMNDFPDQDHLNWAFKNKWCELPLSWNVPPNIRKIVSRRADLFENLPVGYWNQAKEAFQQPKLWHFIGNDKPWHKNYRAKAHEAKAFSDWSSIGDEFANRTNISVMKL